MASKALSTSTFIAQLLAPLPEGEEQVMSPTYIRHLQQDWSRAMRNVRFAEAEHLVSAIGSQLSIAGIKEHHSVYTFRNLREAQAEQCLVPAPTAKELRWKKRLDRSVLQRPEVAAAIARDEARLG